MKRIAQVEDFAYRGEAWLWKYKHQWFVVWVGIGPGNQQEALAFRSDSGGRVNDWTYFARARTSDGVVAEVERLVV